MKRFYDKVTVAPAIGGFAVHLDQRPIKTPLKVPLVLETHALGAAIAREWADQPEEMDAQKFSLTHLAYAVIDRGQSSRAEVIEKIAQYAETDLVCYRVDSPQDLAARQSVAWDPLLAWLAADVGVRLDATAGIFPVVQDSAALTRCRDIVGAFDSWRLGGLIALASLSGSVVIALAVAEGQLSPEQGWRASRIDEDYQAELWGRDEEATRFADAAEVDFYAAASFVALARQRS